jgi:hypothetical protein
MKLIIEHSNTKRQIKGPFALCGSKKDLEQLKEIIENKLNDDFEYGWINVDEIINPDESNFSTIKRQIQKTSTKPISWD